LLIHSKYFRCLIIGDTGCGKTTAVQLLAALIDANNRIEIETNKNEDISYRDDVSGLITINCHQTTEAFIFFFFICY
jgi:ABC-type proline/glycine betaine transport system ATPase subunit